MATKQRTPSKGEINRAGQLWADLRIAYRERGDACFKDFWVDDLLAADHLVKWWREQHAKPLRMVNANLRYYTGKLPGGGFVTQRLKRHNTIVDKLVREPRMQLTRMEDIGGCRVLVQNQADAYALARDLRKNWTIKRFRDYVETPKPSGYRALHLVNTRRERAIEIQIRTPLQDFWANEVERDTRRLGQDFKSGAGPDAVHAYYVAVSEVLAVQESGAAPDKDLMEHVSALYRAAEPYLRRRSHRDQGRRR